MIDQHSALDLAPATPTSGPGYRATVSALALGQVLSWAALYYAFSSFVLPMQRALGWSKPTLMGAFTLGLAVWGAATYAVGAAIDAGRGRAVMTGGSLLAGLGFLAWSQVSAPWMLYAVWAGLGAAMAATLYEPAIAALLRAGLDWRQALQVIGAVLLGVAALHAWALRGPALVAGPHHADALADATLRQALHQSSFWLLTLCFTLHAFVQAALWAHVMPVFASKPVTEAETLLVLMSIGPAQVAGRLLYVWLGRAWRAWHLRVVGALVLSGLPLSMVLFALGQSLPALLLFAALFGVANGLVTIVRGGLVPLYFGRSHVGRIGGLMSGIGLLSRATAPLAASALLGLLPGYRELLLVLAGLGVAAVLAFWWAGPP